MVKRAIAMSCNSIIDMEPQLTEWDSMVGDGDCGETMKSCCLAVLADLEHYPFGHVVACAQALGCSLGKVIAPAERVVRSEK